MPFDGTPAPRDAATLLGELEALLDGGKCGTRDSFADEQGRFCLRGGLDHLRGNCGAGDGRAEMFLLAAISEHFGYEVPTVRANDGAEEFDLIRWFIARARQLALVASGLPAPPVAPVAEHLLPPKAEPGVLFKHLMHDCRLQPVGDVP
jgi:hypothetical protein